MESRVLDEALANIPGLFDELEGPGMVPLLLGSDRCEQAEDSEQKDPKKKEGPVLVNDGALQPVLVCTHRSTSWRSRIRKENRRGGSRGAFRRRGSEFAGSAHG